MCEVIFFKEVVAIPIRTCESGIAPLKAENMLSSALFSNKTSTNGVPGRSGLCDSSACPKAFAKGLNLRVVALFGCPASALVSGSV